MIQTNRRILSIMVLFAVALHLSWALFILIDDSAVNATAVNALARWIVPPPMLAGVLLAAAIAAIFALYGFSRRVWVAVLLLMPQQGLLLMSTAGCIEAIWLSQFADGVIRPRAFLAADQIYSLLTAIGHTAAIITHAKRMRGSNGAE